jgi:hypothetical protein
MTRAQAYRYCEEQKSAATQDTEEDQLRRLVFRMCGTYIEQYGVDDAENRLWKNINAENYHTLDAYYQRRSDLIEQFLNDLHDETLIKRMIARDAIARIADERLEPGASALLKAYQTCLQSALYQAAQGKIPLERSFQVAREKLLSSINTYEEEYSQNIQARIKAQE